MLLSLLFTNSVFFQFSFFMKVKVKLLSCVRLFATPWTVAYQAPPSMGFSRQECWSGLPFPSPGDLPDPGIEPGSPALQADPLLSEPPGKFVPMVQTNSRASQVVLVAKRVPTIPDTHCAPGSVLNPPPP